MDSIDDPKFRSFLISHLRRASRFWKPWADVLKNARKARNQYECAECKGLFPSKLMKRDHIKPVIPVEGFDNWDNTISRIFVSIEGWQALCKPCHDIKTKIENAERRACKKHKAMLQSKDAEKKDIIV
jgi:5-methylcytosine-specific restriction endonuclease McrA